MRLLITSFVLSVLLFGCDRPADPTDTVVSDFDQTKMETAIAGAQESLDRFIGALAEGKGDFFAIKRPYPTRSGEVEHIWITVSTISNGSFIGEIGNIPRDIADLNEGDSVTVPRAEVTDWMIASGRRMFGGYTTRVIEETLPEDERLPLLWAPLGSAP